MDMGASSTHGACSARIFSSQTSRIQITTNSPHFLICFNFPAEMKLQAALTSSFPGVKCLAPKKMVVLDWFVPVTDLSTLVTWQGQMCASPWPMHFTKGQQSSEEKVQP